jgi:hypothetical protein
LQPRKPLQRERRHAARNPVPPNLYSCGAGKRRNRHGWPVDDGAHKAMPHQFDSEGKFLEEANIVARCRRQEK